MGLSFNFDKYSYISYASTFLEKKSLRPVSRILQQLHKDIFMVIPDCVALHNDICMFISYIAGQKNQFVRSFTECVALQNGLKAPLSHVDVSAK